VPQPTAPAPVVITPAEYIHTAKELEFLKGQLNKRVGDNRTWLRMMKLAGALTPEEMTWLEDFYPEKKKNQPRSDEQAEQTRKIKKEAREEIAKERGEEAPEDENGEEDED